MNNSLRQTIEVEGSAADIHEMLLPPDLSDLKAKQKKAKKFEKARKSEKREKVVDSDMVARSSFLRLSLQDKILFAKRLSILVKAGVPILKSLEMMHTQARTRSATKIFKAVVKDVENGHFLSVSLSRFPKIFGYFMINLIQVGEVSGNLHENLAYLADELAKKQALRRKIISAMVYPAIIVVATFGIVGLLTVYLFPKVLPIFEGFQFDLPLATRMLIVGSNVLIGYGIYILAGLLSLFIAIISLMKVRNFKLLVHKLILKLPIFGQIAQGYHLTNICRTMSILLKSGVPITRGIEITAETTSNLAYKDDLIAMAESVSAGDKLSVHFLRHPKLYPIMLTQMVSVGESAGNLSETLAFLSELYENEVDNLTKNLSTALEPALMIFMGLIVGFVAISIITPIYEITQYLKP
jgi:type IV pilus assembly protein PilC